VRNLNIKLSIRQKDHFMTDWYLFKQTK